MNPIPLFNLNSAKNKEYKKENVKIIGDKGFYSQDNVNLLEEKKLM